jgi:hypothetical protein
MAIVRRRRRLSLNQPHNRLREEAELFEGLYHSTRDDLNKLVRAAKHATTNPCPATLNYLNDIAVRVQRPF